MAKMQRHAGRAADQMSVVCVPGAASAAVEALLKVQLAPYRIGALWALGRRLSAAN